MSCQGKKSACISLRCIFPETRKELCEVLGIHSTPNLGKYLGFPIKHPGSTSQDFNFVVERVQNKLQGWKANLLSMAGRVVIAQSVLLGYPCLCYAGVHAAYPSS